MGGVRKWALAIQWGRYVSTRIDPCVRAFNGHRTPSTSRRTGEMQTAQRAYPSFVLFRKYCLVFGPQTNNSCHMMPVYASVLFCQVVHFGPLQLTSVAPQTAPLTKLDCPD